MQAKPAPKKQTPYLVGDNVMETVRSIGGSVGNAVQLEATQKLPDNILQDVFGTPAAREELQPNETVDVTKQEQPRTSPKDLIHALTTQDETLTAKEIAQLRAQLATLAPKTHHAEAKKAMIEQPEQQAGIYHKNRLETIVENIKKLATNPDDGITWFKETGKRQKQKGFWYGYKKHGTSFGLSNERTAATQSG